MVRRLLTLKVSSSLATGPRDTYQQMGLRKSSPNFQCNQSMAEDRSLQHTPRRATLIRPKPQRHYSSYTFSKARDLPFTHLPLNKTVPPNFSTKSTYSRVSGQPLPQTVFSHLTRFSCFTSVESREMPINLICFRLGPLTHSYCLGIDPVPMRSF